MFMLNIVISNSKHVKNHSSVTHILQYFIELVWITIWSYVLPIEVSNIDNELGEVTATYT
jgi:hypothetical protein